MFKEERDECQFQWSMLGDIEEGRPNLGPMVHVAVYRLMQFTLRDVLIKQYGVEAADRIFYAAGETAGKLRYAGQEVVIDGSITTISTRFAAGDGQAATHRLIYHAIHQEMALTLADAVQRRTELGATGLPSATTLQKCAELMGGELGWSRECQEREIDAVIQAYPFGEMAKVAA